MKGKTLNEVMDKFYKLSNARKVDILYEALDLMQQYNGRSNPKCIAIAMGYEYN